MTAPPDAIARVGSSNTRPGLKSETAGVIEAGVDTWRLLFKTSRSHGPEVFDLGPYKAQWIPSLALLCVEGHPGDELTPGDALPAAYERVCGMLEKSYDFRGLSRLDATATHVFSRGPEGLAFLRGMASLDWPRLKPVVWGRPPETVGLTAINSRGRLLARGYDSGLLRGTHGRGEAVRLEDQGRFASGRRPSTDVFSGKYVRRRFQKRFEPMWRAAKGVSVAGLPVLARTVADRVIEGGLTSAEAERMLGFLLCDAAGVAAVGRSRATYFRRRRELREHGLVLADQFYEPVNVDMGEVLEAFLGSPLWGASG